jgi:hypothetical protein
VTFTRANSGNPILSPTGSGFEQGGVMFPVVFYDKDEWDPAKRWKMLYAGFDNVSPTKSEIGYAYSSDGITWTRYASNPIITKGTSGQLDDWGVLPGDIRIDESVSPRKIYLYIGANSQTTLDGSRIWNIIYATSTDWITWTKFNSVALIDRNQSGNTTLSANASLGSSSITVGSNTGFKEGEFIIIGTVGASVIYRIADRPSSTVIVLDTPLRRAYNSGDPVRSYHYHSLFLRHIRKVDKFFMMLYSPFILSGTENMAAALAFSPSGPFYPDYQHKAILQRGQTGAWDTTSAENLAVVKYFDA